MSNSTHAVAEERARPVSSGTSRMTATAHDGLHAQRHTRPTQGTALGEDARCGSRDKFEQTGVTGRPNTTQHMRSSASFSNKVRFTMETHDGLW